MTMPVSELPVSELLLEEFAAAGFKTLSDALAFSGDVLVTEYGFSLHTITELITLLKLHGISDAFQD